jgi:hypothetical protein
MICKKSSLQRFIVRFVGFEDDGGVGYFRSGKGLKQAILIFTLLQPILTQLFSVGI